MTVAFKTLASHNIYSSQKHVASWMDIFAFYKIQLLQINNFDIVRQFQCAHFSLVLVTTTANTDSLAETALQSY